MGFEDGGSLLQAVIRAVQAFLDLAFSCLQAGQAGADLAGGQGGVGGEVEEVFFLPVDRGEFGGELVVQQSLAGGRLLQDFLDVAADAGGEIVRQPLGRPVPEDGVLDVVGRQVREVAGAFFAAQADEVVVPLTVLAGGLGED